MTASARALLPTTGASQCLFPRQVCFNAYRPCCGQSVAWATVRHPAEPTVSRMQGRPGVGKMKKIGDEGTNGTSARVGVGTCVPVAMHPQRSSTGGWIVAKGHRGRFGGAERAFRAGTGWGWDGPGKTCRSTRPQSAYCAPGHRCAICPTDGWRAVDRAALF